MSVITSDSNDTSQYDPTKDPDRGHPTDPTTRSEVIATRSSIVNKQTTGDQQVPGEMVDTNSNNNINEIDFKDEDVIDFSLDTEVLTRAMNQQMAGELPPPEAPPSVSAALDDPAKELDELGPFIPGAFKAIWCVLKQVRPDYGFDKRFELWIWLKLSYGDLSRLSRADGGNEWDSHSFDVYKKDRSGVIANLPRDVLNYIYLLQERLAMVKGRRAYHLIERVKYAMNRYAQKDTPEDPAKVKILTGLYDNAVDVFCRYADRKSGIGSLDVRAVVARMHKFEWNYHYPSGLLHWQRLLQDRLEAGHPKPAPVPKKNKKGSKSRRRSISPPPMYYGILPEVEATPVIPYYVAESKMSLASITKAIEEQPLEADIQGRLQNQLQDVQQKIDAEARRRGYKAAAAVKAGIEDNGDSSKPPPAKKQRLSRDQRGINAVQKTTDIV